MPASSRRALRVLACAVAVAAAALILAPAHAASADPLALSDASASDPALSSSSSSRAPPQPAGPPAAAVVCIVLACCLVLPGVAVALFMACRRAHRPNSYAFVSDAVCTPPRSPLSPHILPHVHTCTHMNTAREPDAAHRRRHGGPRRVIAPALPFPFPFFSFPSLSPTPVCTIHAADVCVYLRMCSVCYVCM